MTGLSTTWQLVFNFFHFDLLSFSEILQKLLVVENSYFEGFKFLEINRCVGRRDFLSINHFSLLHPFIALGQRYVLSVRFDIAEFRKCFESFFERHCFGDCTRCWCSWSRSRRLAPIFQLQIGNFFSWWGTTGICHFWKRQQNSINWFILDLANKYSKHIILTLIYEKTKI